MNNGKRILVILASLLALLVPTGAASAAPAAKPSGKSVCETKGRDNAEYWRKCMTPGTIADAAREYYMVPVGRKGHEQRDGWNRRSVCKFAHEYGGIRQAARELWLDMAFDSYHRYEYVLRWIGVFAKHDCRAMGYRV